MADSQGRSKTSTRRRSIVEALVMLVTDKDIADMTIDAVHMATDPDQKPEIRLRAKDFVFSYIVPKAPSSLDLTTDGEKINTSVDLSKLTADEIIKLAELTNKATDKQ